MCCSEKTQNWTKFRIIVESEVGAVSGQGVQFVFLPLGDATAYTLKLLQEEASV